MGKLAKIINPSFSASALPGSDAIRGIVSDTAPVSDQPCDETGVRNTGIFIAYFIGNSLNGTITSFQHLLGFFQAGRMYAFIRLQHSRPGETPFDCLLGEAATLDHKGNGRFMIEVVYLYLGQSRHSMRGSKHSNVSSTSALTI
jgi:hypothetical protein